MSQKRIRPVLFAGLGLAVLLLSYGAAPAGAHDDLPDISAIMKKAHGKTDGYLARIKTEANAGKWDDAAKDAKSLVLAGDALAKNKPPAGDPKSWEMLTKKYQDQTIAVQKAVEAKDVKGTETAIGAIQASCKDCHVAHKKKK